jgi:hypothetical protein
MNLFKRSKITASIVYLWAAFAAITLVTAIARPEFPFFLVAAVITIGFLLIWYKFSKGG